jgi:4-hydroxybenzoate polyprenyltransferase
MPSTLAQLCVVASVGAWMTAAVALNDLADVEIDRVNLRDDAGRVLANRSASARTVRMIAGGAAVVAVGTATALGPASVVIVIAGLALAAAYSLPPVRLCSRGALTSTLLPLGYVAVPYLVGAEAAGGTRFHPVLLAGLYLGFMGRLVLKDFRDEHGDRLYGKRTFLVRHGRSRTLLFSAVFWSAGAVVALGGVPRRLGTMVAVLAFMLTVLALLSDIVRDDDGTRDTANIATIAVLGRALLVVVLVELGCDIAHRSLLVENVVALGIALASLALAFECRTEALGVSIDSTVPAFAEVPA